MSELIHNIKLAWSHTYRTRQLEGLKFSDIPLDKSYKTYRKDCHFQKLRGLLYMLHKEV